MISPRSHLGALRGTAGATDTFYAASLVDKAGLLTSNAVGSPPGSALQQGKQESERQALNGQDGQDGQEGRVGDLKTAQATQATSSSYPSSYSSSYSLLLDPRPCLRKTPLLDPSSVNGRQGRSQDKIIIMSSNPNPLKRSLDDSGGGPTGPDAKRRKFRACVTCRRQKARCEFVNAHDRCHRCSVLQIPCVFEGQARDNLRAASSNASQSAQSGLPFPHAPPAVPPSAYDNSPKQLPRPSAGSEQQHARYVLSRPFNSFTYPPHNSDQSILIVMTK